MKPCVNGHPNYPGSRYSTSGVCKECNKDRQRAWRKKNPRAVQKYNWKAQGLQFTVAEYETLLLYQDSRCSVCSVNQSSLTRPLYLDHCHRTGKIRGLLCRLCNSGLGHFKDDPSRLRKAADYLEKHL